MFITDPSWKISGVPNALLAPLLPWHSVLLDLSESCFAVMPKAGAEERQTHVRLFSDIDQLARFTQGEPRVVYVFSRIGNEMNVSKVHAIGSYPCLKTGVKFKVYFDENEQPWPAHSGQANFSRELTFEVEASFV